MQKTKNLGLSSLKFLGLIVLSLVVNTIPMRFLVSGQGVSLFCEVLLVLAYLVFLFFLVRTLWRTYQSRLTDEVRSLKIGWKDVGFALLFFLAGRVVAILGTWINLLLSGQDISANDAALQMIGGQMNMAHPLFSLLYLLTLAGIAPVMEELVFRGFGNTLFFKKLVSWSGALVTSLIFALLHVSSLAELPTYLMLGLVIYAAYARRGSLQDSILVHILNNLPMTILMLISLFS